MNTEHYKFYRHSDCEYFPCHKVEDDTDFNCLFCYCPLYALGEGCGGNYRYTETGIKDCTNCILPHSPGGYDHIMGKFGEIMELMKR